MIAKVFRVIGKIILALVLIGILLYLLGRFLPWDDRTVNDQDLQPEPFVAIPETDNAAELLVLEPEQQAVLDAADNFLGEHATSTNVYEEVNLFNGLTDEQIQDRSIVADEEGWNELRESDSTVQRLVERGETWIEYDMTWLPNFVESTNELADTFFAVSARPRYSCMTEIDRELYGNLRLPDCASNNARDLVEVMLARAVYFDRIGNSAEARRHLTAVLDFGNLLLTPEGRKDMVDVLVGVHIMDLALDVLERDLTVSVDTSKYMLDQQVLTEALKDEYIFARQIILSGQGEMWDRPSSYWYQSKQTVNTYAEFMREVVGLATLPCGSQPPTELVRELEEQIISGREITLSKVVQQNFLGEFMSSIFYTSLTGFTDKYCALEERLRN